MRALSDRGLEVRSLQEYHDPIEEAAPADLFRSVEPVASAPHLDSPLDPQRSSS